MFDGNLRKMSTRLVFKDSVVFILNLGPNLK
jgi:hypothetical protein